MFVYTNCSEQPPNKSKKGGKTKKSPNILNTKKAKYIKFLKNGELLALEYDNLEILKYKTGQILFSIDKNGYSSLNFVKKYKYLVMKNKNQNIEVWDLNKKKKIITQKEHKSSINSFFVSPNEEYVFSGDNNGNIFLWDLNSGGIQNKFKITNSSINGIAYNKYNNLLAVGDDGGNIWFYKVYEKKLSSITKNAHKNGIKEIIFSNHGSIYLSLGKNGHVVINNKNGEYIKTINSENNTPLGIEIIKGGRYFVIGYTEGIFKIIDVEDLEIMNTLNINKTGIKSFSIHPEKLKIIYADNLNKLGTSSLQIK